VLCAAFCGLTGLASITLLAFQLALVLRGETTWERLKRHHLNAAAQLPPDERPYDRGPRRNIAIFCGCEADPGVPKWCEGNQGKLAIRPAAAAAAAQKPTDGSYRPPL